MTTPLDERRFPWPHDLKSPYGHLACDDPLFETACAHDGMLLQQHQVNMRVMLAGVAEQVKIGMQRLSEEQQQHGDFTYPPAKVSTPGPVPLADSWWW